MAEKILRGRLQIGAVLARLPLKKMEGFLNGTGLTSSKSNKPRPWQP
jgi:hypothetical protein